MNDALSHPQLAETQDIQLLEQLEGLEYFTPVTIGDYKASKHKGGGYWVKNGQFRFSVKTPSDVLDLIHGLNTQELYLAYHATTGNIRCRGEWLNDKSGKSGYSHAGEFFMSAMNSNGLTPVYHGVRVSEDGEKAAAVVRLADKS